MGDAKTYNGKVIKKGDYVCVHGEMVEVKRVYTSGMLGLVDHYGGKFSIHASLTFDSVRDYLSYKLDQQLILVNNIKASLEDAKSKYTKALKEWVYFHGNKRGWKSGRKTKLDKKAVRE